MRERVLKQPASSTAWQDSAGDKIDETPIATEFTFRWAPLPTVAAPIFGACAVTSSEAQFIEDLARVFAPWKCGEDVPVSLHWRVERRDDRWIIRGEEESKVLKVRDSADAITQIEYASLRHLSESLDSTLFGLHGALLEREGHCILVVGPKKAGKSTLSCALWRNGWHLRCDDFALITSDSEVFPAPRRVSLRAGSQELLGEHLWQAACATPSSCATSEGFLFHPHELDGQTPTSSPRPLAAIFFLGRRLDLLDFTHEIDAMVSPLAPHLAAFALLPHSTLIDRSGWPDTEDLAPDAVLPLGDWGNALPALARLCSHVPVFDLRRGSLETMQTALERALFHD